MDISLLKRDPFDSPTPGQSLTDTPGKWQWEQPPQIVDVEEAFEKIITSIEDPVVTETIGKLLYVGVSIETIVSSMMLKLFGEGIVNPDVAELLKLPTINLVLKIANDYGIEPKVFNGFPKGPPESDELLEILKQTRPSEYVKVMEKANENDAKFLSKIDSQEGFMKKDG